MDNIDSRDPEGKDRVLDLDNFNPDDFTITLKNLTKLRFNKQDLRAIMINLGYIFVLNVALVVCAYLIIFMLGGETGGMPISPE